MSLCRPPLHDDRSVDDVEEGGRKCPVVHRLGEVMLSDNTACMPACLSHHTLQVTATNPVH
jgi:hypothetical protein